jgi:hypothetical protein
MAGNVDNQSSRTIWVVAGERCVALAPHTHSDEAGIGDADGIALDGTTRVLFDSEMEELGGGQVHLHGGLKVHDLGTLTIYDGDGVTHDLRAELSLLGYVGPGEAAGHKSAEWCGRAENVGWTITQSGSPKSEG